MYFDRDNDIEERAKKELTKTLLEKQQQDRAPDARREARTVKHFLLLLISSAVAFAADDAFAIKGATVHTMNGQTIENGTVLVRNGKITGVGKNLAVPKDVKVIDGKGMQVYPGMIDAGTEVGLVEINSVRETSDTTELGKFNPQLVVLTGGESVERTYPCYALQRH
jgi:hypothetical protein